MWQGECSGRIITLDNPSMKTRPLFVDSKWSYTWHPGLEESESVILLKTGWQFIYLEVWEA